MTDTVAQVWGTLKLRLARLAPRGMASQSLGGDPGGVFGMAYQPGGGIHSA